MKGKRSTKQQSILCAATMAAGAMVALSPTAARAADANWTATTGGNWSDATKWSTNPTVPGALGTTDNADSVTVTSASGTRGITVDAGRNVRSIEFAGTANTVSLTGGSLVLTDGGTLQTTGAGAGSAQIFSAITLAGSYTFNSSSSNIARGLVVTGTVAGSAATDQVTALTITGSNVDPGNVSRNILGGIVSDGGAGGKLALVKDGTGMWSLGVANSFSGGVTLRDGTLVMQNIGALGSGTFTMEGGILRGSAGYTITNAAILNGSVSWGSNSTFTFNGPTFTLGDAAGTTRTIDVSGGASSIVTVNPTITASGTATTLRKTGAGTLNLASNVNSFTNLIVEGGLVNASTVISGSGSTYANPTNLGTPFGTGQITLNGGALRIGVTGGGPTGADYNFGVVTQDIAVLAGGGTLNHTGLARSIIHYSGLISGAGKLNLTNSAGGTQDPSAFLLAHANNTYTGGTDINTTGTASTARVLVIADAVNALGGGSGGVGGVVSFVNTSAATVPLTAIPYLTLKANQTVAGLSSARSRAYVTGYSTGTTPVLTINNTAGGAGDGSSYGGYISAGALQQIAGITGSAAAGNNLSLVKTGTGSQILTGMNTYTGGTTINGGALIVNGGATAAVDSVTGTFAANSPTVTLSTAGLVAGQFVYGSGGTFPRQIVSVGSSTVLLSSNVSASAGSMVLSFSALNAAASVSGVTVAATSSTSASTLTVSSAAGLAVGQFIAGTNITTPTQITSISGNVLSLSVATNSGNAVPNGTALTVFGTSGTGAGSVTVNDTGRLAGAGGIAGSVLVNGGGRIAPGATLGSVVGTLRTGSLTLAANATYDADLDFAGPSATGVSDVLAVTGGVTIGGSTLHLSFLNTDGTPGKTFVLLTNDGIDAINGEFVVDPLVGGEVNYTIAYNYNADGGSVGNDVTISFTSVPEPSSLALLGIGAVGALSHRRRRKMIDSEPVRA